MIASLFCLESVSKSCTSEAILVMVSSAVFDGSRRLKRKYQQTFEGRRFASIFCTPTMYVDPIVYLHAEAELNL